MFTEIKDHATYFLNDPHTSQSTAMVMSGRSVHLTTLFPGQALLNSQSVLHTFALTDNNPS